MNNKLLGFCMTLATISWVNCGDLFAQNDSINTIDRSVDVVNAYQPILRKSKKINVEPLMDDTAKYSDKFKYQLLNASPLSLQSPRRSLRQAWISRPTKAHIVQ